MEPVYFELYKRMLDIILYQNKLIIEEFSFWRLREIRKDERE